MKNFLSVFLFLFFSAGLLINTGAQDFQVVTHETSLQDTLGVLEIVFDFEVINSSQSEIAIFEVRTLNELLQDWSSSLCFGENCYAPFVDSIATGDGLQPNLQAGDTLITSIHVTPATVVGTGHIQIQVGTLRNPGERVTLDFYATAVLTDINDLQSPFAYSLEQNYPNPFNPSTNISYSIPERGNVSIKLFDVLGNEIAELLDVEKEAGVYNFTFNTQDYGLSSGVYFYTLRVNDFVQTRKMILEK
jgi:hypothetical protein